MGLIGLLGVAGSGKSTVAEYLENEHGFFNYAFADTLKRAAHEIYGLTEAQLYGDQKEVVDTYWGETPRTLLQRFGTECMRRGHRDDVWVKALHRRIEHRLEDGQNIVISDVRFENEVAAVLSWGGVLWRITRPGAGAKGGIAGHPSEALAGHPPKALAARLIANSGTFVELHAQVDSVVAS